MKTKNIIIYALAPALAYLLASYILPDQAAYAAFAAFITVQANLKTSSKEFWLLLWPITAAIALSYAMTLLTIPMPATLFATVALGLIISTLLKLKPDQIRLVSLYTLFVVILDSSLTLQWSMHRIESVILGGAIGAAMSLLVASTTPKKTMAKTLQAAQEANLQLMELLSNPTLKYSDIEQKLHVAKHKAQEAQEALQALTESQKLKNPKKPSETVKYYQKLTDRVLKDQIRITTIANNLAEGNLPIEVKHTIEQHTRILQTPQHLHERPELIEDLKNSKKKTIDMVRQYDDTGIMLAVTPIMSDLDQMVQSRLIEPTLKPDGSLIKPPDEETSPWADNPVTKNDPETQ